MVEIDANSPSFLISSMMRMNDTVHLFPLVTSVAFCNTGTVCAAKHPSEHKQPEHEHEHDQHEPETLVSVGLQS